jgi:ribonuclease P protein component
MNRKYRLKSTSDFKRVRRNGKSYAHPLAILVACSNDRAAIRFGVQAGKSVGNAVRRNRAKRKLRSAIQKYLPGLQPGWDAILIARPPLNEAEWTTVHTAVRELLVRAGMLVDDDGQ